MRWILLSLILMNLLYFGWEQWVMGDGITTNAPLDLVESSSFKQAIAIKLLSERQAYKETPALEFNIAPVKSDITAIVSSKVAAQNRCPVVGPFKSLDRASEFLLKLIGQEVRAKLNEVSIEQPNDTWVVIPPLDSRKTALTKLRELQAKGIDSYIITQGRLTNAISLGLFKQYESARSVQEIIKEQGYDTILEKHLRQSTEYWVQIDSNEVNQNVDKQIMDLLKVQSTLKSTQTLCE